MNMPADRTPQRLAKIRRVLEKRQKDLTLVLSNIHDQHNVSAIYRSCDAFGVPEAHLYYTDTAFPALAEASSASARKWVRTVRHNSASSLFAALKAGNMRVYATGFTENAKPLAEFDFTLPTAVILGNEHSGVSGELLALADAELYIPMCGMIQSFNVSVAAALILYEAFRQRQAAGLYARASFAPDELETLFELWSKK